MPHCGIIPPLLSRENNNTILSLVRVGETQTADGGRLNASDELIFEDQGNSVKISESRARQWQQCQNGRIVGKWVKGQQEWAKADAQQFMMAVSVNLRGR